MVVKNLKSNLLKFSVIAALVVIGIISCKKSSENPLDLKETVLEGTTTVIVDESVLSIVEEQIQVFESQYRAKINVISKPESEAINTLIKDSSRIAILARKLTDQESKYFSSKNITPRITHFATDAVVLITNSNSKNVNIDLNEVIALMKGKESTVQGLVFENPNSSTVNYMNNLAQVSKGEKKRVYSLKSHEEVLKYIAENKDLVGVVGLNSILQPTPEMAKLLLNIEVMGVKNVKTKSNNTSYYKPSQSNLAAGLYPLQRNLYLLNYQGSVGLGMGFASFIAGDIGQRIILKSGLLPVRIPGRKIAIQKEIENNK